MSDIKQQILDEIESRMTDEESSGYISGLISAYAIIDKNLAGRVIVPTEPTKDMMEALSAERINQAVAVESDSAWNNAVSDYKVMIATFKESS